MAFRITGLLLLIISIPLLSWGQPNKYGTPFVRNFAPLEYGAPEQNWSMVQDKRGVMYFGNNDRGVLEFDGSSWRSIPIPNNSPVRSLTIDDNGTIYVGAIGELGYLAPDESGHLQYRSLTHLIDSAFIDFHDVWKTHVINDTVYFCTSPVIFIYAHNEIRERRIAMGDEELSPFMTFAVNNELYTGTMHRGLIKLSDDGYDVVKNGDLFEMKNILEILPHDDEHVLICTYQSGVYLYNLLSGETDRNIILPEAQQYLIQHGLYHATHLSGGYHAFATLYGGAIITSPDGEFNTLLTYENELRDEQITAVFNNHDDGLQMPLWITMNNGIAYVENHNPLSFFGEESGLRGIVADVRRFEGTLYAATSLGVFRLSYDEGNLPVFKPLDEIRLPATSFAEANLPGKGKRLIVGSQFGVFEIDGSGRVESITGNFAGKTHNCFSLHVSEHHPGRIYLGLAADLEYIEYDGNEWSLNQIRPVRDEIRNIREDLEGNLWLTTFVNGFLRVEFTGQDTLSRYYTTDDGLPELLRNINIAEYGGELLFTTTKGIFRFDGTEDIFYPDERFAEIPGRPESGVYHMVKDKEGLLWISAYDEHERWISVLRMSEDGKYIPDDAPFRPLPPIWCDAIYPDEDSIVWVAISNTIYSYNKNIIRDYRQPFNTLIRRVTLSQIDSVIFDGTNYRLAEDGRMLISGTQPEQIKPRLRFANNRLEFEFASPFFDSHDQTEYSWYLEGEDIGWSAWSGETRAQYTYLREGSYTFWVRARNVYGVESSTASFEFFIHPPWHRTMVAYIGYLILLSLFIYVIVLLNSRRLQKEKIILEGIVRERTAEIVKQKEEIEEQHDMIAEQNKNITDSIEYARRIQTAILPPGDYVKELLPQRFILFLPRDIVSGDFYWLTKLKNRIISVAADCTGHGVPGGFMSMLGIAFLNEVVNKSPDDVTAAEILNQLREQVIASLHQTGKTGEAQDGMDISLFILDMENRNLEFAGANNPLLIIRNNELIEIKGDKMPIGIHDRANQPFTNHVVKLEDGDVIYTFSDGYQDQFGGPKGKKYMIKRLKQLLLDIHQKPMSEQVEILLMELEEWQGSFERVDDIIVMGVRV
ncbi:MAG: hypothetical protein EA408_06545 [Marinilabiliales bacterium]|nr:MAG: hypothetical protein EA408_06545 [Marinilabiliales bacterium]